MDTGSALIIGGVVAIAQGLIQVITRMVDKRNGNGHSKVIYDTKVGVDALCRAVSTFESDHRREQEIMRQMLTNITLLNERMASHFADFKCLARDLDERQ